MTDFTAIRKIHVDFGSHPTLTGVQHHMNSLYSGDLYDLRELFTDDTRTTVVKNVHPVLRDLIILELITPAATETEGIHNITPILNAAPFTVSTNSNHTNRLSTRSLTDEMTAAIDANKIVKVTIQLHRLYFKQPLANVNYLNWGVFTSDPAEAYTATAGDAAPPEAAAAAAAPAGPMSMTDFTNALTEALRASGTATAAALTGAVRAAGPAPAPIGPTIPDYVFNEAGLPRDVRRRWERRQQHKVILCTTVRTRYSNGLRYYLDGTKRLFLSDGTLFIFKDSPDEKNLLRDPITCKEDTHAGLRLWYGNFVQHCMDHGYFVMPLWCFQKDHGGAWGFSIGDGPDDDVPLRLRIPTGQMKSALFRLLQKPGMFPSDSKCPLIVQQCYGDGYHAIKQLLFRSHPVFHDQPSTLISRYPVQGNRSLLEYYALFQDFLQLRAVVSNIDASLDQTHEMDLFITGCKYGKFLNRVTRDERKVDSLAYKYTSDQIVETLETFLTQADSPVHKETSATPRTGLVQPRRSSTTLRGNRVPSRRPAPVNAARVTNNEEVPDLSTTGSDDSLEDLHRELLDMELPNDPVSREVATLYSANIYRLKAAPNPNEPIQCVVCGGTHRFDKCEVLQNTEFLKTHYIRYCQQLRREIQSRTSAFGAPMLPAAEASVRFVDAAQADEIEEHHSDSENEDNRPDFQTGRR